ncbi:hypothetical protein Mapa_005720 [Marchantia paleacea]|nr:hypothetical protein Mapa_005720 [Marchantia paleacea]
MMTSAGLLQATLLFLCIISSSAQNPNYLSIDCGAKINYTDSTGIDWVTDEGYISTGLNVEISLVSIKGQEAYATSRYFPDSQNKHCYVLPSTASTTYLIRVVFLHGGVSVLSLPVKFYVTVNSNLWITRTVRLNDPNVNTPVVYESILFTTKTSIDVCVVRGPEGTPYISSLELRPMPPGTYVTAEGDNRFMDMTYRYNTGPGTEDQFILRYPDDQYDRLWFPANPADFPLAGVISNTTALEFPASHGTGYNLPPEVVLKDAWEGPDLSLSWFLSTGTTRIYLALYFQEIRKNVTVSEADPVGIFISVNGNVYEYNITSRFPKEVFYNLDVEGSTVNVSILKQPWSQADAILNAFEMYDVKYINTTYTLGKDGIALQVLKNSLNLTSWTGDPCYPLPYNWVSCDRNNRISGLFLSNKNLTGAIPSEIGNLAGLQELYLDNNHLTGGIPTSLTLLTSLTTLSLDNNSLSGGIPNSLQNKTGFTFSGNPNLTLCETTDAECNNPISETGSKSSNTGIIIGVVIGVIVAVIVGIGLIVYFVRKSKRNNNRAPVGGALTHYSEPGIAKLSESSYDLSNSKSSVSASNASAQSHPSDRVNAYVAAGFMSMKEVLTATRNHSKKIGEGGYGPVYYGKLANGREVAVKVNKIGASQGSNEFVNEVALLTRVHHRNLVSLLGFCEENNERILVYQYQHNGTLSDLLYGPNSAAKPLNWRTRLDIAVNAAKGLEYLHTGCNPLIIHRDIKSNNILIDDKMVAKVADFGISKSTPDQNMTSNGRMSTAVRGTPGYIDPEYLLTQRSSEKSDVFSFGVVLMEIISGRPPLTVDMDHVPFVLVDMMRKSMETNDIYSIVDPVLGGQFNPESVWKMSEIALASVEREGVKRPSMTEVVRGLAEAMEMEMSSNANGHTRNTSSSRSSSRRP